MTLYYCIGFSTRSCYVENQKVKIKDYDKTQKPICYCKNNHELIYIPKSKDGKKRHFRHKNTNYHGLSTWHEEFQSHFKNTEIQAKKNNNLQNKTRKADVMLNDDTIIEFQNSIISKEEVDSRMNDWKIHNKNIIWVINGNIGVEIHNISDNRCIFYFIDIWKYNSFIEYDDVYLEKEGVVYCIKPKMVKNKYYETNEKIYKTKFINNLNNNILPLIPVNEIDITQSKIYVKQQGAGNGKTYGIVNLLTDKEFEYYDVFIYLTKQHSAKYIILNEIESQKERGLLFDIEFEEFPCYDDIDNNNIYVKYGKQYRINITNKTTNKKKKIIIGTFDSYIFSVKPDTAINPNADKWIESVQSIIDAEKNKQTILYSGENIKLDKKLLLIGDEMQDLNCIYMASILRLIRDNYIDLYSVGDKLQSLLLEDNSFTFLNLELPNTIKKIKFEKINKCRRFENNFLIKFVNYMIDFEKHGVPKIEDNITGLYNKDSLCIFEGHDIHANETNKVKIKEEVDIFMYYLKKEIKENNRKPNDILIISPLVKNNIMCEEIKTHIIELWKELKGDDVIDDMCCVLHKSENGCTINLEESKNATRIVSIHSSKGDQRKVVFVINVTEKILNIFDEKTGGLIFDSLLHVSITRMVEKLYIKYDNTNDIIGKKILKFAEENDLNINPHNGSNVPHISIKLNIEKSHKYNIYEKIYNIFKYDIMKIHEKYKIPNCDIKQNNDIIDIQHHAVRYHTMFILTIITISIFSKNEDEIDEKKVAIVNSLKQIIDFNILEFDKYDYYNLFRNNCDEKYLQRNNNDGTIYHQRLNCLPVMTYKYSKNYNKYCDKIKININSLKKKLKNILYNDEKINVLTTIECLVLSHFFTVVNNKSKLEFPINDLYDIINIFDKTDNLDMIVKSHYYKLNIINNIINIIFNSYKLKNYNVYAKFELESCYDIDTFTVEKNFKLIGYNDDVTIIMYIKPQLNDINYNIIISECIIDLFMIKYCSIINGKEKNIDNRKKIIKNNKLISCVITFDYNQKPYFIDWENEFKNDFYKNNKNHVINTIKEYIIYSCTNNHDKIYDYFIYHYNDNVNVYPMIKESIIISNIIKKYIEDNKKFNPNPKYILNAFNDIKNNIIKKKNSIKYYFDYDIFNGCLVEYLNIDVDEFIECLSMNN